jgi:uncharacterized SAM-binding protein YcdF (DUF218 family)
MRAVVAAVGVLALAVLAARYAGRTLVVADRSRARRRDRRPRRLGRGPRPQAADLYRAGVAPRRRHPRARPPGDRALRARGVELPEPDALTLDALARLGVPRRATVLLRRRTYSTESEARTIARWACSTRVRRLIVVTSPFHTRRARLILAQALGPGVALTIRPSHSGTFSARRWWRVRRDAKHVLTEYQKFAHYWLKERWTIAQCGGLRVRSGACRAGFAGRGTTRSEQRRLTVAVRSVPTREMLSVAGR